MARSAVRVEARYWESGAWDTVTCRLCPHLCSIAPSRTGSCGVRANRDGRLYLETHGKVTLMEAVEAAALPLYHYRPAERWLRLATKGCNLRCSFCNTAMFSQLGGARMLPLTTSDFLDRARAERLIGISFGVNEPAMAHEYVAEVFERARGEGLATHLATAGVWSCDPFVEMLELTTAATFGLKGFDERTLMNECGAHLPVILENLSVALSRRVAVEVTYLVIDSAPDWRQQLEQFGTWLARQNATTPVILMRLEKGFSWKGPSSAVASMREAYELLKGALTNVYVADPAAGLADTRCPRCSNVLIARDGATRLRVGSGDKGCTGCGFPLPFA